MWKDGRRTTKEGRRKDSEKTAVWTSRGRDYGGTKEFSHFYWNLSR